MTNGVIDIAFYIACGICFVVSGSWGVLTLIWLRNVTIERAKKQAIEREKSRVYCDSVQPPQTDLF